MSITETRWLNRAARHLNRWLEAEGVLPAHHVAVHWGFCGGQAHEELGGCWAADISSDGRPQIFVAPIHENDPIAVLATLLHELIHASGPMSHGPRFKHIAQKLGFLAPWTQTPIGPLLRERLERLVKRLGPAPSFARLRVPKPRLPAWSREARLILPSETQHSARVPRAQITAIEKEIASEYGGYTETKGKGGYVMASGELKREAVVVLDIAMKQRGAAKLERLAHKIAVELDQESVYVRLPSGKVEFVR